MENTEKIGWKVKDIISSGDDKMTVVMATGNKYSIARRNGKFRHDYWNVSSESLDELLQTVAEYDREYEIYKNQDY